MRVLTLAVGAAMVMSAHAAAADARFERSLKMLAPSERLEQLCDYTAMTQIRADGQHFRPDRAVASAAIAPRVSEHKIVAKGGAFRSRGKWYALSYSCTADVEHLKVLAFKFAIGGEIPEAKWASYGLWE
jgi:hypothetical protein